MSDSRSLSMVAPREVKASPLVVAAMSRPARAILAMTALSLFLPLLAMGLQDREALEQFHNRTLASWPSGKLLRTDPARYFSHANAWLADRAFPVIAATRFSRAALYETLGVSPQPNVSISQNGFIFLAGGDAAHPYSFPSPTPARAMRMPVTRAAGRYRGHRTLRPNGAHSDRRRPRSDDPDPVW